MEMPLFDAHCDTAFRTLEKGEGLYRNSGHTDLRRGGEYKPRVQVYAIFDEGGDLRAKYRRQLFHLKSQLEMNSGIVSLCTSKADILKTISQGRQAAVISVEGAELLGCGEEGLREAYKDGVRAVNITWNHENALSGSNAEGTDRGLTPAGRDFVRRCSKLGVIVDLSHISDPGFWDTLETAEGQIMASHSNSRAVCAHRRNLTDDMFRALMARGGVAGINLYAEFLGENADIETVVRHIGHFLELGGERNIGIGADFDGCDRLPRGIRGIQDMGRLYEALLNRGVPKNVADDIFFNNFMRIFN